ncbi:hypothetical protein AYI68_g7061 [Smittium mucronatum]|uniref:Uncharacterized protein n=1 Tax=Smittium mucronatum TaxID=133383 RepID=A0A1R0GPR5_9FUNG|nr:hypothetical protein AYI68_g7061 [Smittium mucronatum]
MKGKKLVEIAQAILEMMTDIEKSKLQSTKMPVYKDNFVILDKSFDHKSIFEGREYKEYEILESGFGFIDSYLSKLKRKKFENFDEMKFIMTNILITKKKKEYFKL